MEQRPGPLLGKQRPTPASLPYYRLSLLGILVLVVPVALIFSLDEQLGLDALRRHEWAVFRFVAGEPIAASVLFMAGYGLAVAVSLPGAALLTMLAGYLFGWLHGAICVLVASTVASTALFVFARGTLAGTRRRVGPTVRRLARAFRTNAPSYVFMLHLVPVFPYGMIIALPAACGVRLPTFVVSAFLGILPGTLLLAYLGNEIGRLLTAPGGIQPAALLRPDILGTAAALVALCLLPLAYQALRRRDRRRSL